jgi:DnaA family protein
MTAAATQLPLLLNPSELYHLENFHFVQQELSAAVDSFYRHDDIEFLYLWGDEGVGKTHVLLAISEQYQQQKRRVAYLPMAEMVATTSPELLGQLEQLDLLCIDELDSLNGKADWQESLFHCFNRLKQSGCKLLIAARHNPEGLSLELADLRSRLATGLVYQLKALDDIGKRHVIAKHLSSRGLAVTEDVIQYLQRHYSRDMHQLTVLMDELDKASMAEKRRITIPFIKQFIDS